MSGNKQILGTKRSVKIVKRGKHDYVLNKLTCSIAIG